MFCAPNSKIRATHSTRVLNRDPHYKREHPSYFRQHLISILTKSCSARGRSDPWPKKLQNKTKLNRRKTVRTLIHFKLDESLEHSSLNLLLEFAMQLRKYF